MGNNHIYREIVFSIGIVTRIHWLILRYNVPDDGATVEEQVGIIVVDGHVVEVTRG